MTRSILAPGIEIRESDRSQYESQIQDNSVVDTTTFLMGFTDKGPEYDVKWINTIDTYKSLYGNPKNEAERYTFNGVYEVLSKGGNVFMSRLPYDNPATDKFAYTAYTVSDKLQYTTTPYEIVTSLCGESTRHLYDFFLFPQTDASFLPFIVDEDHVYHLVTEKDEYKMLREFDGYIDFIEYFNFCHIQLSIVNDLINYTQDKCNFTYSTKEAFLELFYDQTDGIYNDYCRNDSSYILSNLYFNTRQMQQQYPEISAEIESMHDSIQEFGGFDQLIYDFGNKNSLYYYRTYFYNLLEQVCSEKGKAMGEDYQYIVKTIIERYEDKVKLNTKFTGIKQTDSTLTSYLEISSNPQCDSKGKKYSGMIDLVDFDKFLVNDTKVPKNQIYFVDITKSKYSNDQLNNCRNEYIGVVPVITTPANAMMYQKIIENNLHDLKEYNTISSLQNCWNNEKYVMEYDDGTTKVYELENIMLSNLTKSSDKKKYAGFTQYMGSESDVTEDDVTLSETANSFFPQLKYRGSIIEKQHIKKIGVVVFQAYVDTANDNMVSFSPVESFVGSLDRKAIDEVTQSQTFIDRIVNTNSKFIRCFSNVRFSENLHIYQEPADSASTFLIANQNVTSLGLYTKDCDKKISINRSIYKSMDRVFDKIYDANSLEIDMILDAGVSTIAQFIQSVYYKTNKGYYDFLNDKSSLFKLEGKEDTRAYSSVLNKFDSFVKNIRKDCIFIADGLRTLCLKSENEKVVRNTKPSNTFETTIAKKIKYITGILNSSYSCGYCNWFYQIDHHSGNYFWCPPSIKESGIINYTDIYFNYWDAPAGLNRGVLPNDVVDVAFNPNDKEAGIIYENNWNYAINYPMQGIVMEGQRTFQTNKTALDRINVRRLMLGLEKQSRRVARYFNYEGITDYLMTRFVDQLTPIFRDAQNKSGLIDYKIICDRRNNTEHTIENNELHCIIAVKPVKSLEFLVMNFIATNQGANVTEIAESEL